MPMNILAGQRPNAKHVIALGSRTQPLAWLNSQKSTRPFLLDAATTMSLCRGIECFHAGAHGNRSVDLVRLSRPG